MSNTLELIDIQIQALEKGIKEKSESFEKLLPFLSKNQLTRLLKSAARFPSSIETTDNSEGSALELLYTIKDMQVEMAMQVLTRMSHEQQGEPNVES
jgi:hypothetical protein